MVQAMRDKFSHVEWISEAFDLARGVKQVSKQCSIIQELEVFGIQRMLINIHE